MLTEDKEEILKVENVSAGYQSKNILHDISFSVKKGEFFGVIGPNGSGKTTLLKLISRMLPLHQGEIFVKNCRLADISVKKLAQIIAVLPQHFSEVFSYTVKETVALGRYAHQKGWFQSWSKEDEKAVQAAMKKTGVQQFEQQLIQYLSGGERQRVYLAQALAQQPDILLLDEPTNHLDLSHQKDLLDRLKQMTKMQGLTVIAVFHDLNLAALYCDRLLLVHKGTAKKIGLTDEVLIQSDIQQVYQTDIIRQAHPTIAKNQMLLIPSIEEDEHETIISEKAVVEYHDRLIVLAPIPLRTMSSIKGAAIGWYQTFVNMFMNEEGAQSFSDYSPVDMKKTIIMRQQNQDRNKIYRYVNLGESSVFFMITGTKRDAIHIWIFVNGKISDDAYIHGIVAATEAKTRILFEHHLPASQQRCSISIAATQQGIQIDSEELYNIIDQHVCDCTEQLLNQE
ncbi:ABC transporter ATP-binding protein [Heyndrickxia ginsengihumi]|uniref:ABC transporter ATP-binding protein n=1 Tax=Heyndrickxia ginsengihumi TaxID=363870 RepID=UPI001969D61D|nr:ATP-binding cassette domain-containing protein [Heyndrickxia ginsengihumi]